MARKHIAKNKDTEPKTTERREKQQTQQAIEPAPHVPMGTSGPYSSMFNKMMPMTMMVLMFAILTPMLKSVAKMTDMGE